MFWNKADVSVRKSSGVWHRQRERERKRVKRTSRTKIKKSFCWFIENDEVQFQIKDFLFKSLGQLLHLKRKKKKVEEVATGVGERSKQGLK